MFTRVLKAIYNLSADVNQKKTLSYIVVRGFSVISNYIFSILVIQLFSKEDYGTFIYGLSVFMIFSVVFKFGVDVHFVKIFSEFKLKGAPKWVKILECRLVWASVITAIVFATTAHIFNFFGTVTHSIIPFILSAPLFVFAQLNSAKLRAISKITQFAFLNIAGRIVLSLFILPVLYFLFSIRVSSIIYASHFIAIILVLIFSLLWTRNEFSYAKSKIAAIPRTFIKYNKALMLKSYVTVLFLWGDRFFLSLFSSPSEVAEYDVSLKIAMLIMVVIEALKTSYAPVIAQNISRPKILYKHIQRSTRVGFVSCCLLFLCLVVFGKVILSFFGAEFIQAYPLVLIIGFGYTVSSFFGQADSVVEMCGLAKDFIKPYFIIITISLLIGVFLSLRFGPIGMAIGFSLSNILFQSYAFNLILKKLKFKTSLF